MEPITIGLFGTCGDSQWRVPFIKAYEEQNIRYFNPVKKDWKPEDATIEAEHLANDEIILFPVTKETFGFGSLGEVGFSILQAIKLDERRDIVVMIDPNVEIDDSLMSLGETIKAEAQKKDSVKMRALIMAHLRKVKYPNVYIVENLENMLKLSLHLHAIQILKQVSKNYTIKF